MASSQRHWLRVRCRQLQQQGRPIRALRLSCIVSERLRMLRTRERQACVCQVLHRLVDALLHPEMSLAAEPAQRCEILQAISEARAT